jgi:hypothetical protein
VLTATEFEFRHRFWVIGAIYFVGFGLYNIDHVNIVQYAIDRTMGAECRFVVPRGVWIRGIARFPGGPTAHRGDGVPAGQAFWSEMFMWGFLVGVAASAITLKIVALGLEAPVWRYGAWLVIDAGGC